MVIITLYLYKFCSPYLRLDRHDRFCRTVGKSEMGMLEILRETSPVKVPKQSSCSSWTDVPARLRCVSRPRGLSMIFTKLSAKGEPTSFRSWSTSLRRLGQVSAKNWLSSSNTDIGLDSLDCSNPALITPDIPRSYRPRGLRCIGSTTAAILSRRRDRSVLWRAFITGKQLHWQCMESSVSGWHRSACKPSHVTSECRRSMQLSCAAWLLENMAKISSVRGPCSSVRMSTMRSHMFLVKKTPGLISYFPYNKSWSTFKQSVSSTSMVANLGHWYNFSRVAIRSRFFTQ